MKWPEMRAVIAGEWTTPRCGAEVGAHLSLSRAALLAYSLREIDAVRPIAAFLRAEEPGDPQSETGQRNTSKMRSVLRGASGRGWE